jgi:hypothetical protein
MAVALPSDAGASRLGGQRLRTASPPAGIIADPANSLIAIEVSRRDMRQQSCSTGTDYGITGRTNLAAGLCRGRPNSGSAAMEDDGLGRDREKN